MDPGSDQGLSKGTIYSGIGHAGLLLWVVVGDFFFSHTPPEVIEVTTVSMMTSDEFAEIQATAPAPSEVVTPEPAPEVVPEPDPQPEPQPQPEPEPVIEPPPAVEPVVEPDPVAQPEQPEPVFVAPEEQALPSTETSIRPQPRPADIVAPQPVIAPEEVAQAEVAVEATSEQPSELPPVEPQDQPEAVQEDSGDVLRTEATEDQDQLVGMTTSLRPQARPSRPAPVETAVETPAEPVETASDTASVDDLLADIPDDAPEEPAQATSGGSEANVPLGPPLTGGEIGDVKAAIGRKWSMGTASTEVMSTTIVVRVSFDPSGKPLDVKLLESDAPSQTATDVAFRTAKSAIVRTYQDGGIPLPPDKYETWKVLDFVFDPNGMRLR